MFKVVLFLRVCCPPVLPLIFPSAGISLCPEVVLLGRPGSCVPVFVALVVVGFRPPLMVSGRARVPFPPCFPGSLQMPLLPFVVVIGLLDVPGSVIDENSHVQVV